MRELISKFEDRAIGSLVGLAVGDALGTTLEFSRRHSKPKLKTIVGGGVFHLEPGQWTDDTSQALCLAHSLLHDPDLDKHDLLSAFSRWQLGGEHSSTGQCFDIGDNTARALRDFRDNGTLIADCHGSSAGNGSIMRLAPVAIRWWKHIEKATDVAVEQCITTHTDPEAIACCELLVKAMCKLIAGGKQDCIIMPNPAWPERVRFIAEGNSIAMKENEISSSGYVIDTLEAAYWAFSNADSFEEAVLMAANLAEDSDTVAAVTGQLAGSYWGLKGIPEQWVDVIHGKKEIEGIAKALYRSQK